MRVPKIPELISNQFRFQANALIAILIKSL